MVLGGHVPPDPWKAREGVGGRQGHPSYIRRASGQCIHQGPNRKQYTQGSGIQGGCNKGTILHGVGRM